MLCPTCHGRHVVTASNGSRPCPECGGMGEVHCCDGLRTQDGCPIDFEEFSAVEPIPDPLVSSE